MRVANVGKVVVSVCMLLLLQGAIARRCAFQLAPSRAGKPAVQRKVLATLSESGRLGKDKPTDGITRLYTRYRDL